MKRKSCQLTALILPCLLALAGCSAVGAIGDVAVETGRRMLLDKAQNNYGAGYTSDLGKVLDIMLVQNLVASHDGDPPAEQEPPIGEEPPEPEYVPQPASVELPALELELTVVREVVFDGRPTPIPVEDGAVLRDGVGRDGDGDNLKIQFRTNAPCHVYAVWVDATAWATPIFPVSPAYTYTNPVGAGQRFSLPESTDWFFLDGFRGVENLYFVASHEPLPELDELLRNLVGRKRAPKTVEEIDPVDQPPATRGIGGVRPGAMAQVKASDGSTHQVATQTFVSQLAGGDLVVTKWFRHE